MTSSVNIPQGNNQLKEILSSNNKMTSSLAKNFMDKFEQAIRILRVLDVGSNDYFHTKNNLQNELKTLLEVQKHGISIVQEPKYGIYSNHIYNRASGEFIPDDEPVMIFRARDNVFTTYLTKYLENFPVDSDHYKAVKHRLDQFQKFALEHPERMKYPDTIWNNSHITWSDRLFNSYQVSESDSNTKKYVATLKDKEMSNTPPPPKSPEQVLEELITKITVSNLHKRARDRDIDLNLASNAAVHENNIYLFVSSVEKDDLYDVRTVNENKLIACAVAAQANTVSSVVDRLTPDHPYYSPAYHEVCRAVDREIALRNENEKLNVELEILRMQLAGCGVAAMSNTPESVKSRLQPGHPYYSASYGDICTMVDKQMTAHAELNWIKLKDKPGHIVTVISPQDSFSVPVGPGRAVRARFTRSMLVGLFHSISSVNGMPHDPVYTEFADTSETVDVDSEYFDKVNSENVCGQLTDFTITEDGEIKAKWVHYDNDLGNAIEGVLYTPENQAKSRLAIKVLPRVALGANGTFVINAYDVTTSKMVA